MNKATNIYAKNKISVVTICFNQEKYIDCAIKSVLSQKTDQVEYIVVDGGSTDKSRQIIQSYEGYIDKIIFENDEGPADGLNIGFSRANGNIGIFINGDDFLLPGAVTTILSNWTKTSNTDMVMFGVYLVDENGNFLRRMLPTRTSNKTILESSSVVAQQGLTFKMDKFREIGGFNAQNFTCWDGELVYDFVRMGAKIARSYNCVGGFRKHGENLSIGYGDDDFWNKWEKDMKRMRDKFDGENLWHVLVRATALHRVLKYIRNPEVFFVRIWDYVRRW